MLRGHLSAVLTLAFLGLLVLVTVSDQGPDATWATVLLGLLAAGVFVLFLATERALHRGHR